MVALEKADPEIAVALVDPEVADLVFVEQAGFEVAVELVGHPANSRVGLEMLVAQSVAEFPVY